MIHWETFNYKNREFLFDFKFDFGNSHQEVDVMDVGYITNFKGEGRRKYLWALEHGTLDGYSNV
jgi:hypothetical protein